MSSHPHAPITLSETRRNVVSFLAVLAFSLMLAGTSKRPSPSTDGGAASAGAPFGSAPVAASGTWRVPDSSAWMETKLPKARISVRLPPSARIGGESYAPAREASSFSFTTPSGYRVNFGEKNSTPPVDIERERAVQAANPGLSIVWSDPNALVVTGAFGSHYCEVTACSPQPDKRLCAIAEGMVIEGDKTTKLTDEECMQVVAVARSIAALP